MKAIVNEYHDLIKKFYANQEDFTKGYFGLCTAEIGTSYHKDNEILMIIGRAGGVSDEYKFAKDVNNLNSVLSNIDCNDDTDWVIDCWGNHDCEYNPKKSAFWRVSKKIASILIEEREDILKAIVHSNLYKIVPHKGRNPSTKLQNLTHENCTNLIRMEMDFYKPKIAIFLTGLNWAEAFIDTLVIKNDLGDSEGYEYVEFIGKYKGTIVIVSQHPQTRPENEHVSEILSFLTK